MKLAVLQFTPTFGELSLNQGYIVESIKNTKADILVFPELALSGYDFKSREEAITYSNKTNDLFFNELSSLAKQENKIICLGFAESEEKKLFNSVAIFFPEDKYNAVYRKTHLFFNERNIFDENDKGFAVVDYKPLGIKIGMMICYDWRFPEAARTLALLGADLILCPSNLVTNVWQIAMPARALENKVYLAIANRIGTENRNGIELKFNGKSAIYGFNGEILAQAGTEIDEVIYADINPEDTRDKSFNKINNLFEDRRPKWYFK